METKMIGDGAVGFDGHVDTKPTLLFLRFTRRGLPEFLLRHLREQEECLSTWFNVVTISDEHCNYAELCDRYEPELSLIESGVYVGKRRLDNFNANRDIPRIGFMHCDAFCSSRKIAANDMDRWQIATIFTTSVALPSYFPEIASRLYVWPNFVDTNVFHPYPMEKIAPIIITGSQATHYPWRNKITGILSENYPSLNCPHFGWTGEADGVGNRLLHGAAYAKAISSCQMAPTCGSFANDLVRKHLEIPACGTCLISERSPVLEAAGFEDFRNCVFADSSDVLDKVDHLLNHPSELERVSAAGLELVRTRHAMRCRDQIWQWFCLKKHETDANTITQDGPLATLRLAAVSNRAAALPTGSQDRELLQAVDENISARQTEPARKLCRSCLNLYEMPEFRLRLAICMLLDGDALSAISTLQKLIEPVLEQGVGSEPDPVELAYLLLAYVCQGNVQRANELRKRHPGITHAELHRVDGVLETLAKSPASLGACPHSRMNRASVHSLPNKSVVSWMDLLSDMLSACGQHRIQQRILEKRPKPSDEAPVSPVLGLDSLTTDDQSCAIKSHRPGRASIYSPWERTQIRIARRCRLIRNASQREILRIGRRFAPQFGRHRRPNGLLQAIKGTLQSGDIKTILILGASAKSSLTRLAVEAARSNPNLPTVTCAGLPVDTGFRQLSRRLESIPEFFFVDLRHVIDDFKKSDFRIDAVVIDQIDGRLALQLSQHGLNCDFIFVSVKPEMSEDASVLDWIDGRKYFTTREWPLETGSMLMMKRREPAVEQPVPCCFE